MDVIETTVRHEPWDVDRRLKEMELDRKGLLRVRDVALNEAANATDFHPANAAGTFAYQHGTWALRDQFVGGNWVDDRIDGVEAIRNDALKLKIAFSNVDLACDDNHSPKPRSQRVPVRSAPVVAIFSVAYHTMLHVPQESGRCITSWWTSGARRSLQGPL